jgi:hypothetical protein
MIRPVLGVTEPREASASELAALSRSDLDRELALPAELRVSVVSDEAIFLGAFGRMEGRSRGSAGPLLLRRGSGGPPVVVGPGTIHVALSLVYPAVLVACDEKRIVNRYVRPLLRALTASSTSQAHFFGRDWISLAHRPVGWVGFAHDASSRSTLFEAFVAVRTPSALTPRASFLDKPQATLEELAGRPVDALALAEAIIKAYGRDAGVVTLPPLPPPAETAVLSEEDPPWSATREEAIGPIGAGPDSRGVFRVGGDLLVSRDALARLEARVAGGGELSEDELGRIVDETLGAPGVALDGVRSLASVRDVIAAALHG